MVKGINKASFYEKLRSVIDSETISNRPCVFLSHKKEDKPACREIADYLKNAGIDYYLDELDLDLQRAVSNEDSIKITEGIKKGIRESTHMLVIVSEKTYKSQWVPFEVGYGHAAIIDKTLEIDKREDKIKLSILTLKDISEKMLPDYMQVGFIIRGTKSLNDYISKIIGRLEKYLVTENILQENTKSPHPLDAILNWKI
jgi:hypothetical protein